MTGWGKSQSASDASNATTAPQPTRSSTLDPVTTHISATPTAQKPQEKSENSDTSIVPRRRYTPCLHPHTTAPSVGLAARRGPVLRGARNDFTLAAWFNEPVPWG